MLPCTHYVTVLLQSVAQRYCGDCKSTYHELSKLIRGVLALSEELVEYDRSKQMIKPSDNEPSTSVVTPSQSSSASLSTPDVQVGDSNLPLLPF